MIKVIFLLAYDYKFVKTSLPLVYAGADKILFSLDADRLSWSGNRFDFDESILDWIKDFDIHHKIEIFQDKFYLEGKTAMQNDTRQRQMSSDYLGEGGWTLMIDVDEYFINFEKFVTFLNSKELYLKNKKKIMFGVNWINLFKQDENGYYYIKNSNTVTKIATNHPIYSAARNVLIQTYYTDFYIVHQSWARSDEEMEFKLKNWGHNSDVVNAKNYFEFWRAINIQNYRKIKNFSPYKKDNSWKELGFIPAKQVRDLFTLDFKKMKVTNPVYIMIKNFTQNLRYSIWPN